MRPTRLEDIIGQEKLIQTLNISINSANKRKDSLGHTILSGPAGLGKTTLATAIANELGSDIYVANGASIKNSEKLLNYLIKLEDRDVLFIDEIHRMPISVYEFLYPVMEDFRMDMVEENGEVISDFIEKFTLIGATTELGSLPKPLRDRFKVQATLETYNKKDISKIIYSNCQSNDLKITNNAISYLAGVCRGTPRIAISLVEWLRDYCIAKGIRVATEAHTEAAMSMKEIGPDGSTLDDRKYLNFLKKQNKPVGVSTISSSINIDVETIETVIEPWLLSNNKILKTLKGRVIND